MLIMVRHGKLAIISLHIDSPEGKTLMILMTHVHANRLE